MGCITASIAGDTVELEELVSVPTVIRNAGSLTILCQAEIAHWFAADLARVAPGERVELELLFAPHTGVWAVLNAGGEALPLERAWCGLEGRTYETRWPLALGRENPVTVTLECHDGASSLHCR